MKNKRFPNYPDDTDYTTNAPSYYDDLARKNKLIELLSKRIWEYDEELAKRFDAWDKNLEDFPEDVKILLQTWVENGTLDHIINDTIFNWKLDTTIFEQFRNVTTTQLQQTKDDIENHGFILKAVEGTVDYAPVIMDLLTEHTHVFIPRGVWNIYTTVNIKQGQVLTIGDGARLVKPADAFNNYPVVWLTGLNSVVRGVNRLTSLVQSFIPTPYGVVSIGYLNMSDVEAKNTVYTTLTNIGIIGHTPNGSQNGEASIGLSLVNPQVNGQASYFHSISMLYIANANIGMLLEGWANANIISDIQFYRTGGNKWLGGGAIVMRDTDGKAPIDNVITDVFHHGSTGADTLVLNGAVNYNMITNISSEPGGAGARFIYATLVGERQPGGNVITGIDNVSGGSTRPAEFDTLNTFIRRRALTTGGITSSTLTVNELATFKESTQEKMTVGTKKFSEFVKGSLPENSKIPILAMPISTRMSGFVKIEVALTHTTIEGFNQLATTKVGIKRGTSGVSSFEVYYGGSKELLITHEIDDNVVTFYIQTQNNGSATTSTAARILYEVSGSISNGVINEL